jgi:hypothetical protein
MNRAERRRAARIERDNLNEFSKACAGFCQVYALHGGNIGGLIEVMDGDPCLRVAYFAILRWMVEALPYDRAICLDCDIRFTPSLRPSCLVVAVPFANPVGGAVSGVCKDCLTRGDLSEMTVRRYREIWPSVFQVAGGGHA